MTREIVPELVARIRHVADSLDAIARGEVDSPQPVIAAYAVYLNGEYDSSYGPDAIDEALEIASDCNGDVIPLYRQPQPTLTAEEREAIVYFATFHSSPREADAKHGKALGTMLERLA